MITTIMSAKAWKGGSFSHTKPFPVPTSYITVLIIAVFVLCDRNQPIRTVCTKNGEEMIVIMYSD